MSLAYSEYLQKPKEILAFYIRRFFRIYLILWIATLVTVIQAKRVNGEALFRIHDIILNLTGAFGFLNPERYIAIGAWSLGNELVYYALTSIILWLFNKRKMFGNLFCFFLYL